MKTYGLIFTTGNPASAPAVSLVPTLTTFFQIGGTSLTAPGITKPISNLGLYTFEWSPTLPIYFLADGGTLITDNTQRYLSGILDPLDLENEKSTTILAYAASLLALGTTNVALGTTNVAIGTSNIALGTTSISTSVAYGSSNVALGMTNVALGTTGIAYGILINNQATSLTAQGVSIYAVALTIWAQTATIAISVSGIVVNVSINGAAIDEINLKLGSTLSAIGTTTVDPGDVFGFLKRAQEFREGSQTFSKSTGAWSIASRGGTVLAIKTVTNTSSQVTRS